MRGRAGIAAAALIALMALGSVMIWIGLPIAWLWIASQVQGGSSEPSMAPYGLVVVGLPLSIAAVGKVLASLDRAYGRVTGRQPEERRQRAWLKSMRGERIVQRRYAVLDVVMVTSVSLAGMAFVVWFFFFAGSSLPSG
ncbi:MAG: hypothetical protein WBC33_13495 [Conexibacter sp.]